MLKWVYYQFLLPMKKKISSSPFPFLVRVGFDEVPSGGGLLGYLYGVTWAELESHFGVPEGSSLDGKVSRCYYFNVSGVFVSLYDFKEESLPIHVGLRGPVAGEGVVTLGYLAMLLGGYAVTRLGRQLSFSSSK